VRDEMKSKGATGRSLIRSKNERCLQTRTRYKTGKVSEGPFLRQANLRKIA